MQKHFLLVAILMMVAACSQSDSTENDLIEAEPIVDATPSPLSACAQQFRSISPTTSGAEPRLLFQHVRDQFEWGAAQGTTNSKAESVIGPIDRSRSGFVAQANGLTDWVEFEYLGNDGGLSRVNERHNNRSRQPPFVAGFIAELKRELGEAAEVQGVDGECRATWTTPSDEIRAEWRDSEWYIEINYEPSSQIGEAELSANQEREIWRHYVAIEDKRGREAALAETASAFGLSQADVREIMIKGLEQGWSIPSRS